MEDVKLSTIEEAIEDFREGKFVIVVDDEDRENEGDFIIAAEKITPEKVNFMLKHGRGVLCAPIPRIYDYLLKILGDPKKPPSVCSAIFCLQGERGPRRSACGRGLTAKKTSILPHNFPQTPLRKKQNTV